MKKTLIAALALVSSAAFAGAAENMVGQCEAVMRCGLCQIAIDPNDYPNGIPLPVKDSSGKVIGNRRVKAAEYNWFKQPGYAREADGTHTMCNRVAIVMREPDSVRAEGARVMFNGDWDGSPYCPRELQVH